METTLNIPIDILDIITRAAQSSSMSRSEMITLLLKKMMDDVSEPDRMGTLVRYQRRSDKEKWHVFHLQVRMDDYEYFLDLRKLLKMSVSLILANAVMKYLGKHQALPTDNYWFKNYVIIKETINNVICWKFFWGFPPDLRRFLPKS